MRQKAWSFKSPVCWRLSTFYNMRGLVTHSLLTWAAKLNLTEKKSKCHRTFCYKRCLKLSSSTSFSLFTDNVPLAWIGHPTPCVKSLAQCLNFTAHGISPFAGQSITSHMCRRRCGHVDPFFWLTDSTHLLRLGTDCWVKYVYSAQCPVSGKHMGMWPFKPDLLLERRPTGKLIPWPLAPSCSHHCYLRSPNWTRPFGSLFIQTEMESQRSALLFRFMFWP